MKSPRNLEAIGPTQPVPDGNPPNPQDRIFAGALPTVMPTGLTARYPFSCPTRNPLHYLEGPGTDEVVTTPERRTPRDLELRESAGQPGREGATGGPNNPKTLGGAEIYGT